METIKEINPFKEQNIELLEETPASNERFGATNLGNVKEFQVGWGSEVFRSDQNGIWLGASKFENAPFRIDMQGNVTANSITLSGYVQVGGSASDINSNATTISGGKITTGSITTDKLIAGTITGFTIIGGTITGTVINTASSGQRITLFSSRMAFYNSSDTEIADITASGSSLLISGVQSSSNIYINSGSLGVVGLLTGSTLRTIQSSTYFAPYNDSEIDLGTSSYNFKNLFLSQFVNLGQMTGSTATGLSARNGSMYYRTDDNVIRVYLNGTWRTITTS